MKYSVLFCIGLVMFSSVAMSGRIHELARQGQWNEVNQLVAQGASVYEPDLDGQTVYDIALKQDALGLLNFNQHCGYQIDLGPSHVLPPAYIQPLAPTRQVMNDNYPRENPEAARLQARLADEILRQLEAHQAKVARFDNPGDCVRYIAANKAHVQQLANNLRAHMTQAFVLSGRGGELEGLNVLEETTPFQNDQSRLATRKVEPGHCTQSKCNKALTNSFWARDVVNCMHCEVGCTRRECFSESACCWAYCGSLGLYSIPVGFTALVTTIAQGFAIAASAPCLCQWVPAKTEQVGQIDIATEAKLNSFIDQMKVIREQLHNAEPNN